MELTDEEQQMLRGERGLPLQKAIQYQVEVGSFFGAKRLVPVTNAHFMGDIEVMGDDGLQRLDNLARQGARCAIDTTNNARCMDLDAAEGLGQDPAEIKKEHKVIRVLRDMRVVTTDTCINYQTVYQPKLGEHVAWGDTGTVIYANSVFGARTNFESGFAGMSAALTGRTPAYGFHLDEHRRGSIEVTLETPLEDLADWGAIGKIVGHPHQDYFSVPVFQGVEQMPSSDALKHLGASLASYGSMAMYHIAGITPEAPSLAAAFDGRAPSARITITRDDLDAVYGAYRYVSGGPNLVVFSGPQQSLLEIRALAELFAGRKVAPGMQVFLTTNHAVLADARRLGYADILEGAGVRILQGVCFYLLQRLSRIREENGWTNLVSNSAKIVNTITAHRFNTVLRRTRDCVDIACTGELK
ncbi:MAG TPA: aconitase X catalytic domain-containing protein [Bordetella sp.]|nr:aconitase X catalytic domain-containing protein [Bordetella sp.]